MIELLLSDARGIYIPRDFVQCFDSKAWHLKSEDIRALLKSPDSHYYWDVWDHVLSFAYFVDDKDRTWRLYQEGDLFAICDDISDEQWEAFIC
jgi:hypothetical protein